MQRLWGNIVLVLMAAFVLASCGDGRQKGRGEGSEGEARKQVITEKGSDTMILLANRWAEAYAKKKPSVEVQVTGGGSGTGISALINGTTDIANASRQMKDEERAQVKQKFGNDPIEIPVARDGITIYVNAANTLEQITIAQLRDLFLGKVTNWKQIGGPDQKVILYGRENSSGTYEFFKEHVLEKADFAPETQTLSGTAAVVQAVAKDKGGVGYGGEAYGTGDIKKLKLVGNDGKGVEVTEENVRSGVYPLSRSLYFYVREQPTGAIKDYIDWVLSNEGQAEVKAAGYFPLK
jgi:phosphate transport system substrate-binding protein